MIKHLPKMARRHYISATADSGSKWRAGASTSLAVLRRPSMAKALARSRLTRPRTAPEAHSTPLCLGLPAGRSALAAWLPKRLALEIDPVSRTLKDLNGKEVTEIMK